MFTYIKREKESILYLTFLRCTVFVLSFSLIFGPSAVQAQSILNLPIPGTMIQPSPAFVPVLLKGMTIYPDDPLKFDFIIDSGNTDFTADEVKQESEKLLKYFLASMTVPKDDLWVNLSPYEDDRIIPDELGKTVLGRDMLAQDYILKQLTASLMYPEKELGKKFWNKVYSKAEEQFGTRDIPVNTFNKVWILPETATVYEHEQTVYVVDAHLKVMLDSDYQAMQYEKSSNQDSNLELQSSIIKEIIIPEIEKEVNEGRHFAPLRQIYHSLILAKWYKETIKNSLLTQVYADKNMIDGVDIEDKTIKDQVYAQYMKAYKKGVFDYIKEDYDALSKEMIPRKYFSGGIPIASSLKLDSIPKVNPVSVEYIGEGYKAGVQVMGQKNGASSPIIGKIGKWYKELTLRKQLHYTSIDKNERVRIAEELGELGNPKAIKDLLVAVGRYYHPVQIESLKKLGMTIEEVKIHFLRNLVSSSYEKRFRSIGTVGNLKDKRAIEFLKKTLLYDEQSQARDASAESLKQLGEDKFVQEFLIERERSRGRIEELIRSKLPKHMRSRAYLDINTAYAYILRDGEFQVSYTEDSIIVMVLSARIGGGKWRKSFKELWKSSSPISSVDDVGVADNQSSSPVSSPITSQNARMLALVAAACMGGGCVIDPVKKNENIPLKDNTDTIENEVKPQDPLTLDERIEKNIAVILKIPTYASDVRSAKNDIVEIGAPAIPYLTSFLESKNHRLRAVAFELLKGMKWKPSSFEEEIKFYLAEGVRGNWDMILLKGSYRPHVLGIDLILDGLIFNIDPIDHIFISVNLS